MKSKFQITEKNNEIEVFLPATGNTYRAKRDEQGKVYATSAIDLMIVLKALRGGK